MMESFERFFTLQSKDDEGDGGGAAWGRLQLDCWEGAYLEGRDLFVGTPFIMVYVCVNQVVVVIFESDVL